LHQPEEGREGLSLGFLSGVCGAPECSIGRRREGGGIVHVVLVSVK